MTRDEAFALVAEVTASEAAERLAGLDVAAMGANHGAGLLAALHALTDCCILTKNTAQGTPAEKDRSGTTPTAQGRFLAHMGKPPRHTRSHAGPA